MYKQEGNKTAAREWLLFDQTAFKKWQERDGEDNSDFLNRLKINLRYALEHELTDTQRRYLLAYYGNQMNIPKVAEEFGVNRSTVSRELSRSRKKLLHVLQYTSPHLLGTDFLARNKPGRKKTRKRRRRVS